MAAERNGRRRYEVVSGDIIGEVTEDDIANAKRIRSCLIEHGPMREKELRDKTGLDSIGAYYAYLRRTFGIGRLWAPMNWPDGDDKMYFLPSQMDPQWDLRQRRA